MTTSSDPLESYIEKKVCAHATKTGWLVRKLEWVGRHGAPDRFFAKGGRIVLIEFKRRGKKPTEHQSKEIDRLREVGVEVHVADNIEDGIAILDRRVNHRPGDEDLI